MLSRELIMIAKSFAKAATVFSQELEKLNEGMCKCKSDAQEDRYQDAEVGIIPPDRYQGTPPPETYRFYKTAQVPLTAESYARLDSKGYPWDKRIHNEDRSFIADGTWKLKNNVSSELIEKVRADQTLKHIHTKLAEVGVIQDTPPPEAPKVQDAPVIPSEPMPSTMVSPPLDSKGYPWDKRIHSKGRSFITNGTWRLKRGVDSELVKEVQAEWDLKHTTSVPETPHEHTTPVPETPSEQIAPDVPIPPVAPDAIANTLTTFPDFMDALRTASPPIASKTVIEVCQKHGVENGYTELSERPEMIKPVAEDLGLKK